MAFLDAQIGFFVGQMLRVVPPSVLVCSLSSRESHAGSPPPLPPTSESTTPPASSLLLPPFARRGPRTGGGGLLQTLIVPGREAVTIAPDTTDTHDNRSPSIAFDCIRLGKEKISVTVEGECSTSGLCPYQDGLDEGDLLSRRCRMELGSVGPMLECTSYRSRHAIITVEATPPTTSSTRHGSKHQRVLR